MTTPTTPPDRTFTVTAFLNARDVDVAASDREFTVTDED